MRMHTFNGFALWLATVTIFGDDAGKLVFTGEDYPTSVPGYGNLDLPNNGTWDFSRIGLLQDAIIAGLGIRNGITEKYDSHLNQVPAYGLTIQPNGHVAADENWVAYDGRVLGTENECFVGCGIDNPVEANSPEHLHEVIMANFKALQMRMNWIYAGSGSNVANFSDHWEWVRHSLGRQRGDAFDAWAVLRESRDTFFAVRTTRRAPVPKWSEIGSDARGSAIWSAGLFNGMYVVTASLRLVARR